jgi:hypothetical protein
MCGTGSGDNILPEATVAVPDKVAPEATAAPVIRAYGKFYRIDMAEWDV